MHCYTYPRPAVSVDTVLFTLLRGKLRLLLIRRGGEPFRGKWALPGGFIEMDEPLQHAAQRELEEETGLHDLPLEQFHTFGKPVRDPRGRVISVAYFGVLASEQRQPSAGSDADETAWFALDSLPPLAFDHADIITLAHQRLRQRIDESQLAFAFLGECFTLSALQSVYEVIRQQTLDKRNFRKWIQAHVEETGGLHREGKHRPAKLYRRRAPGGQVEEKG